eukprot:488008-Amphidinium_carterae.1
MPEKGSAAKAVSWHTCRRRAYSADTQNSLAHMPGIQLRRSTALSRPTAECQENAPLGSWRTCRPRGRREDKAFSFKYKFASRGRVKHMTQPCSYLLVYVWHTSCSHVYLAHSMAQGHEP